MNILLIQLKRSGDLILTTPAIAAIRDKFPGASISLVVSSAVKELLPAITGIDKVFEVRGKTDDAFDWIALSLGKFDYCLDFTRNDRSSFLTFLSGARKRITSDHPKLRTRLRARSYNEFVEAPVGFLHTVDYHLALLKALGIENASRAIRLELPEEAVTTADQFLGTPQVVLFGPTNPFHWHPRSESALVLLGGNEGPMTEFNPKQRAVPMNQISTQTVIDAMEALLSAPAARAL